MEGASGIVYGLHHLDQEATLAVNSLSSPFTDGVWMLFSDRKVWYLLYAALALMLFVRMDWKKALVVLVSVALTVVACDQAANLVKYSVARLRPVWDNYMVSGGLHRLEGRGSFYGFFSAHAANALGVAVAVVMGFRSGDKTRSYRGLAWIMYTWAVLVGLSRVFVGKHFLGDVTVGFCVGLLIGWIFGTLARWIIGKLLLHL